MKYSKVLVFVILWAHFACVTLTATNDTTDEQTCPMKLKPATDGNGFHPVLKKYESALLMLLGFGGFSLMVAIIYSSIRKYIYHDMHNLDTVFDAGGRVTLSLTAVTVTSQLLWPADFLQSSTIAAKTGPAGSLWFSLGIVVDIMLFPLLSVHLKTKAPGAKTFLQIVYARFGKPAHIVFTSIALIANLITISGLILAGQAAIQTLTEDASDEFVVFVLAVLFGSYCFIGGLGTTFYISYFNTALTFITVVVFILSVGYFADDEVSKFASPEAMYKALQCIAGPEGNYGESFLTFRSRSGVIYGVVLMFMATSLSFCDQANWQCRIAAKPVQGVVGFLIAALLWFAIPTTMSLTAAMTYMSASFQNGTHTLSEAEIDRGIITPRIMEMVMGVSGGYLLLTMLTMALMSTGSGEVMAISSIAVYDIYKIYVNPFRTNTSSTICPLCGQDKINRIKNKKTDQEVCQCSSSLDCEDCSRDIELRTKGSYGIKYQCQTHGMYRHYEDLLIRHKSWCIAWVVVMIIPYGLIIMSTGVNLNWAVLTGQVIMSPFLVPLLLTITWSKATASGVIAGSISGVACSISAVLIAGSLYDGGLSNFMVNTAQDYSLLAGLCSGLFVSTSVTIVTSLCTNHIHTNHDAEAEWEKTLSIDNPLNPWPLLYHDELCGVINENDKITSSVMSNVFRKAKLTAYIGCSIGFVIFIVIIPAVMLSIDILSFGQFSGWLKFCQIWCMAGMVFVVIAPPAEEIVQIWRRRKENMKQKRMQNVIGEDNPL